MKLKQRVLFHLFFWVCWVAYTLLHHFNLYSRNIETSVLKQVAGNNYGIVLMIVFFYINYLILLPVYFRKKNNVHYLLSLLTTITIYIPLYSYAVAYRGYLFFGDPHPASWNASMIEATNVVIFYLVVSLGFGLFEKWFENDLIQKELQKEKLSKELAFLRNQVNPAFVFNTLKDINEMAVINSPHTAEAVLDLSDIMRYMLYESTDEKVPVEKELDNLRIFLHLLALRFNKIASFKLSVVDSLHKAMIEPMLLITLAELSTHLKATAAIPSQILLTLKVEEKETVFTIENSLDPEDTSLLSGKGFKHYLRRLNLLYPGMHVLEVRLSAAKPVVYLKLISQ